MQKSKSEPKADPVPEPPGAPVARLVDIAREAGVSVSTAGRVLRNSQLPVAAEVAERVREIARRLGYVPNLLARNLRGARPRTIGLVVGDMLDPYYGTVAEAVTERAESEHGLLAVVCNIQRDPALELKYCQQLWEHRVAGLILTGGGFDQHAHARELAALTDAMQASGLVVCTLGPRLIKAPMFCVDNHAAGRMAAARLLAAGHRRIGILNGNALSETGRLRLAGCLDELKQAGIEPQLCQIDYRTEEVAAAMSRLMKQRPRITGLLATSDFMAASALDWLDAAGVSVPAAVSLVAIRGAESARSARALTSVDVQIAACSRAALDHIAARSLGKTPPAASLVPLLREGDTLAAPR